MVSSAMSSFVLIQQYLKHMTELDDQSQLSLGGVRLNPAACAHKFLTLD